MPASSWTTASETRVSAQSGYSLNDHYGCWANARQTLHSSLAGICTRIEEKQGMFRQSGHHRIMGAHESPRDDGFRCGESCMILTYTSESPTSLEEGKSIDDDLSWWS